MRPLKRHGIRINYKQPLVAQSEVETARRYPVPTLFATIAIETVVITPKGRAPDVSGIVYSIELHADTRDNAMHQHAPIGLHSYHQVISFALLVFMSPNFSAGQFIFLPQSKAQLKSAVDNCLKSPRDLDCSKDIFGAIEEWDEFHLHGCDIVQP